VILQDNSLKYINGR